MKRHMTTTLLIASCLLLVGASACAQVSSEQRLPEPRAAGQTRSEWAIAPPGTALPEGTTLPAETRFPEGTVLQEGTVLPAGTVLPGGAILPGVSAGGVPQSAGQGATPAPEPADEPDGVPYVSGGIGASGREEMDSLKHKFNLRMLFAVQGSGEYLADIKVRIDDAAGPTLLTAVSQGPWFYANLAPGRYVLTVDNAGQVQTRQIMVPATGATQQDFYWPPD